MGQFQRSGKFKSRDTFLETLKTKVGKLREGTLKGMKEEWKKEGGSDTGVLSGFGVNVTFSVRASDWDCKADIPVWLPIPQSKVEHIFDKEFEDLKNL